MSDYKIYGFCETGCKREVVSKDQYLNTIPKYNMVKHNLNHYIYGTSPIYFDLSDKLNGWVFIQGVIVNYNTDGSFKSANYVSFNGYVSKSMTGDITFESNEPTSYDTHTGKVRLNIFFADDGTVGLLAYLKGDNGTSYYFNQNEFSVVNVYRVVEQTDLVAEVLEGEY